jgi:hypothetical protein
MSYNYTASGTIRIGGCSDTFLQQYISIRYSIGSVLYLRQKALKGKLEKIAIRDVILPTSLNIWGSNLCNNCNITPIYKDTYNSLYNESDLISYDEAIELATNYLIWYSAEVENQVIQCKG